MPRPVPIALLAAGALAACAPFAQRPAPLGQPASAAPADRLVAAIETEGCVLPRHTVGSVLPPAHDTKAELATLTPELAAQGRAEASGEGAIRVLSDNCI